MSKSRFIRNAVWNGVCLISGYNSHLIKQCSSDSTSQRLHKVHSLSSSGVLVYLPVSISRSATPHQNFAKADL